MSKSEPAPVRPGRILILDDNPTTLEVFRMALELDGHHVWTVTRAQEAIEIVSADELDMALVDLHLERKEEGVDILRRIKQIKPELIVLIMSADPTPTSIITAYRSGAYDFLLKPVHVGQIAEKLQRAVSLRDIGRKRALAGKEVERQRRQILGLQQQVERSYAFGEILGASPAMRDLRVLLHEVSQTDATLLITGESGTGKNFIARTIHYNSPRKEGPFVEANCAVFTDALLNSELFGHEKGAFTGAIRQKKGRFELAQGGTLFLDEIGDLQPSTQLRLLRVLQDRRIERVGGEKTIELDVRIIAATHRDLRRRIAEGLFREDLFYRLSVLPVHVPPLRERLEDLPVLAAGILKRKKHSIASAAEHFAPETLRCLAACSWPGNVRELENVVEFAMVFAKGPTIEPEHLPTHLRGNFAARPSNSRPTLEQVERRYIAEVLQECGQNKKLAAQILGIQRSTLYSKLRRYGLEP